MSTKTSHKPQAKRRGARLQRVPLLFGTPGCGFLHSHRLRKAHPRNRAKSGASFISVRCLFALFDLAIDTQNQLRKQEAAPPRVLGMFPNLAAGATPNLSICTRARARGPLSRKVFKRRVFRPEGRISHLFPLHIPRTPSAAFETLLPFD